MSVSLFFNTCITFGWDLFKWGNSQITCFCRYISSKKQFFSHIHNCSFFPNVRYDIMIFKSYLLKMQYLKLIMKFSTFQRGTLFFILLTIKFKNHFIFQHQFFWKMTPSAYLPLPFPLFKVQMMTFAKFLHFSADILFFYSKAANSINFYGW